MYKPQISHASFVKNGLLSNTYQGNLLLQAYIKSKALFDSHKLLQSIPNPNVVSYNTILSGFFKSNLVTEALKLFDSSPVKDCQSWNIVISGFVQNQRFEQALTHFVKMRQSSINPDNFTYSILIPCCDLGFGRQVHAEIVKVCLDWDEFLGTNFIRFYAEMGDMYAARKMFDEMLKRDLVTWNALIFCYSKYGIGNESIELFKELCRDGIVADSYTYATLINEFASRLKVFEAMQVHSLIIRCGFCSDRFIRNCLVSLYSKCGFVSSAFLLFKYMSDKDVVSWTSIISAFLNRGHTKEAFWVFHEMRLAEVDPNSFTFGALQSACSSSSALRKGKQFHGLILKFGLESNVIVGSAIVDMYSKCGDLDDAMREFQNMPKRDIVSWNAIICGYAQNGESKKALELYNQLVQSEPPDISPNDVTFVGVLGACGHSGLVEEGYKYFDEMIYKHAIKPKKEHYTCMIDLLGRVGLLDEAEAIMRNLPLKPDFVMWGALLGACKLHGNLKMAKQIAKQLYIDEQRNSSNYVLLANTYIDIGGWREAVEVREAMEARGVEKTVGCSWVEIGSCMHCFTASDKLHPHIEVIIETLGRFYLQIDEWDEHKLNSFQSINEN